MNFQEDKQPLISVRGTKVALGPYTIEHHKITLTSIQDPDVSILSGNTFNVSLPEPDPVEFKGLSKNASLFTIFELDNLSMIGNCGLREIDYRQGTATFGISIARKDSWGKGYGTEATRLTLDYGFRFLNLHNILLRVTSFNDRAQNAYLKAGFKEIGRHRQAVLINNQRYDVIFMDCLREDYKVPLPGWSMPF